MLKQWFLIVKQYFWKILLGLLLGLTAGFFWYVNDYYHAEPNALAVLNQIDVIDQKDYIELKADSSIGIIFYPGAKVEPSAYLVLFNQLKLKGINVFITKMPFNLAVLKVNAADSILNHYPEIQHWYLAGHSLGGAMASSYLEENADVFDGLILLAAYPLNDSEENVLTLYGTQDKVLDLSKLEPYESTPIEGGNHAYFGDYGEQAGDGKASISRSDQQALTAKHILDFIHR
jgi:hypothetical protein